MTKESITLGEVHTGLLRQPAAITAAAAARLLNISPGGAVTRSDRPISHVTSPPLLTGVDCGIPTANGARVRGIGTVTSHASITGGHLLQGASFATVQRGQSDRRQSWSHYLARPGHILTLTKVNVDQVASGFLEGPSSPDHLDLDAIGQRTVDAIQERGRLDYRTALKAGRTRVRFVIQTDVTNGDPPGVTFTIKDHSLRTLSMTGNASVASCIELCEDLARHDWLLTTLLSQLETSQPSRDGASPLTFVSRLRPVLDHLLHLWMPAARTDAALADVWRALEARPGFSRQWKVNVDRIRDQVALGLLERLGAGPQERVDRSG